MKDLDRLLRDALNTQASRYEPRDAEAAESRFLRKRGRRRLLRTGGAGLVAAAAAVSIFALVQPEVVNDREDQGPQPAALQVADRYRVAEEPLSVATGAGDIWIASRAAGVVSALDPSTGEITEHDLDGASQVVIAGETAWAAGPRGVIEIPRDSGSGSVIVDFPPDVVDMSATDAGGPVWLVMSSGCVADVTQLETKDLCAGPDNFHTTDVASTDKETWLLDGASGDLHQLHAEPGVIQRRRTIDASAPLATAPAGRYADLLLSTVAGSDVLWASGEGGKLLRLDLETGESTTSDFPGDYIDLAEGYGGIWALVGHEGRDRGDLVRLDVATGQEIGTALALSGKPSDVAADPSGVWVTLRDTNEVVRIVAPDAEPAPVETSAPTPMEGDEEEALNRPLGPDDLVMVFSGSGRRGGETYAMFGDGHTEPITAPVEADLYPSFVRALYSEGPAVVVERRNLKTLYSDLLYVDVPTGEETQLVPGSLPAMSPDGQLAYWRMEKENATLFITEIGTDFERQIHLTRGLPTSIAWDAAGRFVYVTETATNQNGDKTATVTSYDSTGELGPIELDPGPNANFLAPSSREHDTVHLIRIESDDETDGPIDSVKLVEVPSASSDPGPHIDLVALAGLGIDENALRPENLRLQATGTLDASVEADGMITWGIGEERSWILGFRTQAWLVKESGEIVPLGELGNGGLAVSPDLLER